MNVLLPPNPPLFPSQHDPSPFYPNPTLNPFSSTMTTRKRKADEDIESNRLNPHDRGDNDDNMSVSPAASPAISSRPLARPSKKIRSNDVSGRPLTLPRLLETLDAESLRSVLQAICQRHPQIGAEVVTSAPRPSVSSALHVLSEYQERLQVAFPFGGNNGSDYSYNRVKNELTALLDALSDFTPHYLPPNETHITTSLGFLDGATKVIHDLPEWESSSQKHHKEDAYEEISKAWALVITEASKRGGGFQLHNGEWDQKVNKHNEQSGGRLHLAVSALGSNLGWMATGSNEAGDARSIRAELLSGTYGSNVPVRVGLW